MLPHLIPCTTVGTCWHSAGTSGLQSWLCDLGQALGLSEPQSPRCNVGKPPTAHTMLNKRCSSSCITPLPSLFQCTLKTVFLPPTSEVPSAQRWKIVAYIYFQMWPCFLLLLLLLFLDLRYSLYLCTTHPHQTPYPQHKIYDVLFC